MATTPFGLDMGRKARVRKSSTRQDRLDKFGILQPQEVILQLFGEYVSGNDRAWSGGLVQLLGDLGFSSAASRVALNRVIARGLLAPSKEGRFVFYTITPRLKFVHDEGRRQTYSPVSSPDWTGTWTLVCYAVPEEHRPQRARLGRWLGMRGFGSLQEGIWIGAGDNEADVRRLTTRLGFAKHSLVFVGHLGEESDVRSAVERGWNIDELKKMYDIYVSEFAAYRKAGKRASLQPRDAFVLRTRVIEMFRQTTIKDPRMPDSILKVKWKRKEAIETFRELQDALCPQASSYFRELAVTGTYEA